MCATIVQSPVTVKLKCMKPDQTPLISTHPTETGRVCDHQSSIRSTFENCRASADRQKRHILPDDCTGSAGYPHRMDGLDREPGFPA